MHALPATLARRLRHLVVPASTAFTLGACAMLGPAVPLDPYETVQVRNASTGPMQIYLVGEWTTTRLGQVDPGETRHLRILSGDLYRGTIAIAAVPIGGRGINGGPAGSPHTIRSQQMLGTDLPWLSWEVTDQRIMASPRPRSR
jgi:hypothetical protein